MSRYHESFYEPQFEYGNADEDYYVSQEDYEIDLGYLEDDLEAYGEYDDDFSSVWG